MSSPQTEDGYTRIANELLEAILRFPFSKRGLNIVLAVIRKTYGYGKKTDIIGGTLLAEMTGMGRQHAAETVTELVTLGVLIRSGSSVGLNKKYTEWQAKSVTKTVTPTVTKTVTPEMGGCHQNGDKSVTKTVTKVSPKRVHTKEKRKKKLYVAAKPPTREEVLAYCEERKNGISADAFIAHYESNGWKVGKNPMVDWQAAVRTWEAKRNEQGGRQSDDELFRGSL